MAFVSRAPLNIVYVFRQCFRKPLDKQFNKSATPLRVVRRFIFRSVLVNLDRQEFAQNATNAQNASCLFQKHLIFELFRNSALKKQYPNIYKTPYFVDYVISFIDPFIFILSPRAYNVAKYGRNNCEICAVLRLTPGFRN